MILNYDEDPLTLSWAKATEYLFRQSLATLPTGSAVVFVAATAVAVNSVVVVAVTGVAATAVVIVIYGCCYCCCRSCCRDLVRVCFNLRPDFSFQHFDFRSNQHRGLVP